MATEQELLHLSRQKWNWLIKSNIDALDELADEQCMFVHMGATVPKSLELELVKSGMLQYKSAEIQEQSVRFFGETAIVLCQLTLRAVAGGQELTNPFMVTEVYTQQSDKPKLAWLAFTRIVTSPSEPR